MATKFEKNLPPIFDFYSVRQFQEKVFLKKTHLKLEKYESNPKSLYMIREVRYFY